MSRKKDTPVLSISILASRNKDLVRRCLDSLTPIREQIPSELILVDTSKDPDVHKMLLEYTDQVVEFEWCNDFAKARNVGLSLARGEWFLYLDDDEWFVEIDELLDFFKSGKYKRYGCANYIQRNFHDADFTYYSDSWASRMIRRTKETHFCSRIHEYLDPAPGECINLHVVVNHTGYIFVTEEDKMRHYERNSVLLKQMIEEEPNRLRWRVQLVQEYVTVKYWKELEALCRESIDKTKDWEDEWDCRDIGTFYAGLIEAYIQQKKLTEAIRLAGEVFSDKRMTALCQANILSQLVRIYYMKENWDKAMEAVQQYFAIRKDLEGRPRRLEIQQGALLVGETFDDVPTKRIYSQWIACGLKKGDISLLKEHFHRLGWDKKVIYLNDELFYAVVEAMTKLPQDPIFVEVMQRAWDNKELQKKMFVEIQGWAGKDEKAFTRLLEIVAQVQGEQWYLWYARILVADWHGESGELPQLWEGFCRNTPDVFATPADVLGIMNKNHISVGDGYKAVPFERWMEQLAEYFAKVSGQDVLITERELRELDDGDIRFSYGVMRIAEWKVLSSVQEDSYVKKRKCMQEFADAVREFHRAYYTPQVLENYPELLPEYVQAGLLIDKALLWESQDTDQALACWGEAARANPDFAEAVKFYLKGFGEEQLQKERRQKEEMRRLEMQVLAQVQDCIKKHQYEEALRILKELQEMKPRDLELTELILRTRLNMIEASRAQRV